MLHELLPQKEVEALYALHQERFNRYTEELLKWQKLVQLLSKGDASPEVIRTRHIENALLLFTPPFQSQLCDPAIKKVDLGAGGGFPSIPLALCGAQNMVLIESNGKKASFLRHLIGLLGLSKQQITVVEERIELLPALEAHFFLARALAPLSELFAFVERHGLKDEKGRLICQTCFFKGEKYQKECTDALKHWSYRSDVYYSKEQHSWLLHCTSLIPIHS